MNFFTFEEYGKSAFRFVINLANKVTKTTYKEKLHV